MLYSLVISLYTSRIILDALGSIDYGIYNVVGSIVSMFIFLRFAMSSSTHRFITYALGKGNIHELNRIFSTSVIIHIIIAILIIILAETIGLWFLIHKLVIPENRMNAALWCYQYSILTCALTVICVPYDAVIIAHEKMKVFAYIQIINSTLNLFKAFFITITTSDKLICYAFLLVSVQIGNRMFYGIYCSKKFSECHFVLVKDLGLIKEMTSFAGWSLIGKMIWIGYTQGVNILLNLFCGPIVNSARGLAVHVQSIIKGFISNIHMAVNPQITKSYASSDLSRMRSLLFFSSKISFFLLLFLSLPIIIETPKILQLWLIKVPDHTVSFVRISLFISLIDTLDNPIVISNNATGKIKIFQIVIGLINLNIIIFSYISLKLGYPPESVFLIQFVICLIALFVKIRLVAHKLNLSIKKYFANVFLRCISVLTISLGSSILIYFILSESLFDAALVSIFCLFIVSFSSYLIGLSDNERFLVRNYVKNKCFSYLKR